MAHTIRIGYLRRPDGSAVPVCEPPVDAFLLVLWRRAAEVTLEGDGCVVLGTVGGGIAFEGTMRPNDLFVAVSRMVANCLSAMGALVEQIDAQYPFARIADDVVRRARGSVLINLDREFVVTEAPAFAENGRIELEPPRVEFDDGRLRVVVTGIAEDYPLRAWADGLIRARVHEAILLAVARDDTIGTC